MWKWLPFFNDDLTLHFINLSAPSSASSAFAIWFPCLDIFLMSHWHQFCQPRCVTLLCQNLRVGVISRTLMLSLLGVTSSQTLDDWQETVEKKYHLMFKLPWEQKWKEDCGCPPSMDVDPSCSKLSSVSRYFQCFGGGSHILSCPLLSLQLCKGTFHRHHLRRAQCTEQAVS